MKYLWFLLLLSLPFQLGHHLWFPFSYINGLRVDYLAPAIYLQDIFIIGLLLFSFGKRKILISNLKYVSVLSVVFVLFVLFNIFLSFSPLLTFYSFLHLFQFVLLVKLSVQEKEKIIKLLKYVLPISAISQLAISIVQVTTSSSVGGLLYWLGERSFNITTPDIAKAYIFNHVWLRPYGTFSHPNSLAGFMLLVFILSWVFLTGKTKWLTMITSFLVVVLSFSQSAWLALFIVLLYLFLSRFSKQNRIYIGVTALVLTLFFLISFPNLITYLITQLNTSPSLLVRLSLLKVSWSIFSSHPIIGVGLGNFIIALGQDSNFTRLIHWYQPVHNIFVLWIVETGLVGIGLLLYSIKKVITQIILLPNTYFISLTLIVILTTGTLDHFWLTLIQNRLLLAITLGLIISCHNESRLIITKTIKIKD